MRAMRHPAAQRRPHGVPGVAAGVMLTLFVISCALVVPTALNAVLQGARRAQ